MFGLILKLWALRNTDKGRRARRVAKHTSLATAALYLYIDHGNRVQDQHLADLVEEGRQKHAAIEKMGDVRYAAAIQILGNLEHGISELQQDARSTREMTLTLLKESRARSAQLKLMGVPKEQQVSSLSPGLFPAWLNRGNDSHSKSKE